LLYSHHEFSTNGYLNNSYRSNNPEDIGKAVVWFCSDVSDYFNGITLIEAGGMTLYPGFATGG
jgi:hypothetical protein